MRGAMADAREPDVTLEVRKRQPRSPPPGAWYTQKGVMLSKKEHARLVSDVALCRAAGLTSISASCLLRIAYRRLDIRRLIAELVVSDGPHRPKRKHRRTRPARQEPEPTK